MKVFLRQISRFLILLCVVFALIGTCNYWLIKLTKVNFSPDSNILVLGDSNSECAINDKVFKRSENVSAPAESYYYSYLKLEKILEYNQTIDTVLLSFSPHNTFDNTWFESKNHIKHNFCRYYPFMSVEDFNCLLKEQPQSVVYALRPIALQFLKNIFRTITNSDPLQLGGFTALGLDRLESALQSLRTGAKIKDFKLPKNFNTTTIELIYLNKIVELCRDKQVKLILINLPKHAELLSDKRYGVGEFHKLYNTRFNQIDYFDFSNFSDEDKFFSDLVHLNKVGAIYFSNFLKKGNWEEFRYD